MGDALAVTVVWASAPRTVQEWSLHLPTDSTVADALQACAGVPSGDGRAWSLSVWGKPVVPESVLRANDRVELCAPLLVDPKEARRQRFARQGSRTPGLFARGKPPRKRQNT